MSNRVETLQSRPVSTAAPGGDAPSMELEESVRAKLEDAMAICERRFACLPSIPNIAVYACDKEGRTVCFNERACVLIGESVEPRRAECCSGLKLLRLDGTAITRAECPMARALETKRPAFGEEMLLQSSEGILTRVCGQAEPIFDERGNLIGAVSALLQIHEHIQTSRRDQLHARVLQQAGKAAICTDPLGIITFWNSAATETFGWTAEEVLGRNVMEIVHVQLTQEQSQEIEARLHAGESWDGECKARHKDGRDFSMSITTSPILDDVGNLVGIVGLGSDIDKAARAAKALQASEERYHTLFSSMSEGLALGEMMYDANGEAFNYRCLDLNPAAEKCLGLPREVLLGRTLRDFVADPNADALRHFEEVVRTGVPARFEFFSKHLGKRFSVVAFRPAPQQFAVLLQDITEQRKTLDALRASEGRYRGLYNAIGGGVVVQDKDGKIVDANPNACEMLGLSKEQLRGLTAYDPRWHSVKEDGSPAAPEDHPSVITRQSGQPVAGCVMGFFRPADNDYRWMLINTQPVLDSVTGILDSVVITFVDITPRKRAEEALRRSREQFEVFMDSLPGYAWIKNFKGQYLYLNRACIKTLRPGTEWKGKTASELWEPRVAKQFEETDVDVIQKGALVQVTDAAGTHGQGGYLVSKFPIIRDRDDESVICGLAIDATSMQRTMEQLRRRQSQLADANRRLQAEISKISEEERRRLGQDLHDDICQNLVGVSLLCGELAVALSASDPADADLASRIEKMICDAVKDIRSLARGLHPVTLERHGLIPALQELAERISSSKAPCAVEVDCGPIRRGHRASLCLYRIAQEALTNSLKHAEATKLGIKLATEGAMLVLSVSDNGIGIGKTNPQGMGLHIMEYRARAIGGSLSVVSPAEGGTTITCRVPISG